MPDLDSHRLVQLSVKRSDSFWRDRLEVDFSGLSEIIPNDGLTPKQTYFFYYYILNYMDNPETYLVKIMDYLEIISPQVYNRILYSDSNDLYLVFSDLEAKLYQYDIDSDKSYMIDDNGYEHTVISGYENIFRQGTEYRDTGTSFIIKIS